MSALLKTMAQRLSFASRVAGSHLVMPAFPTRVASPRSMVTTASMGKTELIKLVQTKAQLTDTQASEAVNTILEIITDTVAQGKKVTIPGFGVFEARTRAARKGRNPRTGEVLFIGETVAPYFSAGKNFKEKVKAAGQ